MANKEDLVVFINSYKKSRGRKSSSQVVEGALMLLHEQDLANTYKEVDSHGDVVAGDGLGDETW